MEEQVRRIVCESGHLYGHDSDGNVFTNSEETYRGAEGSRFISHGEWSDPEIWYNGKSANANDVEDMMREYYKEECEERETFLPMRNLIICLPNGLKNIWMNISLKCNCFHNIRKNLYDIEPFIFEYGSLLYRLFGMMGCFSNSLHLFRLPVRIV